MSTDTVAGVIATKAPGFVGDSRITDFDTFAQMYAAQSAFGDKWVYARALIVIHMLTLDAQGGGDSSGSGSGIVGGIKSEKEGDLARSYNSMQNNDKPNDAYWNSTSFGSEFLQLKRACLLLPITSRVGAFVTT